VREREPGQLAADLVVPVNDEAAVREDLLDELFEPDEVEGRGAFWHFDQEVDVRVLAGPLARNGAEHREPGVAVLRSQHLIAGRW
jgi:hypothetical protein